MVFLLKILFSFCERRKSLSINIGNVFAIMLEILKFNEVKTDLSSPKIVVFIAWLCRDGAVYVSGNLQTHFFSASS